MTPSQQHPKKRKAPPPSDAVLAGQEFYQQQLRKSLGGGAPPRRRRTTTSTGQTTPAAAQLRHRQRRAAHWRASQNNHNNNHNNARSNNIHNEFDHEYDPEEDDEEEEEEANNDSSKDDRTLHDYASSSSPTTMNGGRAAKRARRHSPSPPPPQAEPEAAAAAAPQPSIVTATTAAATPPSAPSSWKRTVLKPSPVQQGQDYYQAQMEKKTSPVVRVSEPPIILAARARPSLPLVPSEDRAAAPHKNNNSSSNLRRRHAQPNLELIPKESEENATTEDDDDDATSFLDAIPEPSSPPRGNENKKTRRTILGWVAVVVVAAPVLLTVAWTTLSSSSSTSVSPLQLGWTWCQSSIPKTSLSWPQFGSSSSSSSSYRTPSGPPCFADSADIDASTDTDATTFAPPHHCRDEQPRTTPCPPHAVCRGGMLQHCRHHHYLQSNGTACVLTPSARDTVHATRDLLAKYSVHVLCGSSSKQRYHPLFHQYDNGEGGVPLFRYRPLVETYLQTRYEPELLELANEEKLIFVLRTAATSTTTPEDQQDDSLLLVGLHPQYPLDIPLRCTLRKYVGMSTQLVGAVLLGVLGILGSYLWDSLVTAPLQTIVLVGGGSVLLWWIGGIRRRNRAKRQRDLDIVNLRHAAHLQLQQQSGGGTAAPHLRDALAWEWYPTNRAQRQYLQHQLWPCVVQDLCSDSRVECRYENGELIWQWRAAAAALPKPRVQFASERRPKELP